LSTSSEKARSRHEDCPALYDEALFERLRQWRKSTADEISKPAFVVFTDATLETVAERRPTSLQDLLAVPGVGRQKLEAYGEELLEIISTFAEA
jgi:DNA helicase-2/ATP-dependent DNA helicase PcrA